MTLRNGPTVVGPSPATSKPSISWKACFAAMSLAFRAWEKAPNFMLSYAVAGPAWHGQPDGALSYADRHFPEVPPRQHVQQGARRGLQPLFHLLGIADRAVRQPSGHLRDEGGMGRARERVVDDEALHLHLHPQQRRHDLRAVVGAVGPAGQVVPGGHAVDRHLGYLFEQRQPP